MKPINFGFFWMFLAMLLGFALGVITEKKVQYGLFEGKARIETNLTEVKE